MTNKSNWCDMTCERKFTESIQKSAFSIIYGWFNHAVGIPRGNDYLLPVIFIHQLLGYTNFVPVLLCIRCIPNTDISYLTACHIRLGLCLSAMHHKPKNKWIYCHLLIFINVLSRFLIDKTLNWEHKKTSVGNMNFIALFFAIKSISFPIVCIRFENIPIRLYPPHFPAYTISYIFNFKLTEKRDMLNSLKPVISFSWFDIDW